MARNKGLKSKKVLAYIAPSVITLSIIALVPILYAIWNSFFRSNIHRLSEKIFIGFGNYIELFTDSRFLNSLKVTILYTFISVSLTMIIGFTLALLLQKNFRLKNISMALITIPMIMAPVVSSLIWRFFLFEATSGIINWLLSFVGIRGPVWLASSPWALISVMVVNTWFMIPFVLLIMEAALSGMPREPIEAAMIDGANYWRRVFHIIIPALKVPILFTLVFRITTDFRMFDIVYTMTFGGPAFDTEVVSIWVYNTALRANEIGYSSAGAVIMMIIIAVICMVILKASQKRKDEE